MIVSSYVMTAIGIPVYYHYCGGELEEINYVLKGTSCCGGEEEDTEDNGCCKDENLVLKSSSDFTLKELQAYVFLKSVADVFYIALPFSVNVVSADLPDAAYLANAPPSSQRAGIIATSVLRI